MYKHEGLQAIEKVKAGNDQKKAQPESKPHPKNPRREKTKLKVGYFENIP